MERRISFIASNRSCILARRVRGAEEVTQLSQDVTFFIPSKLDIRNMFGCISVLGVLRKIDRGRRVGIKQVCLRCSCYIK